MASHWPWVVLQIAPTQDRKLIRDAYSRLLKALDPDAATEAFMELREARDAALSGDFLHPSSHLIDESIEDDFGLGDPLPEGVKSPPSDFKDTEKLQFTVEYSDEDEKQIRRVFDLVTGEGTLTESEMGELQAQLDALFTDDRMGDLGHYARIETWLAQLIAECYPRSAVMFPRAAEYFRWNDRVHELGIHPAIPWLFHAYEGDSLAQELGTLGHEYYREWNELAQGKVQGPLWLRAINKQRMNNLIATIRRDYPWLEQRHWQPELVARWEKKVAGNGPSSSTLWIWIGIMVLLFALLPRIVGNDRGMPQSHNTQVVLSEAEIAARADEILAAFLDRNFSDSVANGKTLESLKTKSPIIYQLLFNRAQDLPDDLTQVDTILMQELANLYFPAIDKLPFERQVLDARYRAAALKQMRKEPDACIDFMLDPIRFIRGANAHFILEDGLYKKLIYSALHDDYAEMQWKVKKKDFVLPGEVVGKLVQRSGLSEKRVRATFTSEQPPASDRCIVYGSLLELMTEIPRSQADNILPALL